MSAAPEQGRAAIARGTDDAAFLERLGQRVRASRGRRGLSRKALAGYAGVSERYLAQLETGQGNISIILLRQVARALDMPLEQLVSEDAGRADDIEAIVNLLRHATPRERAAARRALGRERRPDGTHARAHRLAFIGLRGAGKSTLGRLIARDLDVAFVELNDEIEIMSGLSVPEIFNLYGPEGYRRLERRCLEQVVANHERVVLAPAGGVVADPATFDLVLGSFFTVWLKAAPEEHMMRVRAQGDVRPMADSTEAMEELKLILGAREALYARADRHVDTSGRSVEQSRRDLTALLASEELVPVLDDASD